MQRATAVEQAAGGDVDFASLWYAGVPEALTRLTASMGGTDAVGVCTSNLRPIVEATMQAVRSSRRAVCICNLNPLLDAHHTHTPINALDSRNGLAFRR